MALITDSISETLDMVSELLRGVPPESRHRAKATAVEIERCVNLIRKDHPNDPAVGLGLAFAIFKTAEQLIEADRDNAKQQRGLIHLLS